MFLCFCAEILDSLNQFYTLIPLYMVLHIFVPISILLVSFTLGAIIWAHSMLSDSEPHFWISMISFSPLILFDTILYIFESGLLIAFYLKGYDSDPFHG